MVKNILDDIFSDLDSESSVIMPKSIKIKSIKSADTISDATSSFMPQKEGYSDGTSSFMPQEGGYLAISDATSSFMPQKGGHYTSSNKKNNKDIKQYQFDSPTSESYYTANNNNTEELRDNLYNILQEGGAPGLLESMKTLSQKVRSILPSRTPAPAMNTEHTHIIYSCCLIDENLVQKIVDLKNKNIKNGKKTIIYINTNPFNFWGTSIGGAAFGDSYYKGIKYLQDLFILKGLLIEKVPDNETYDNAINFITHLRNNNIIVFDSADYLLKPFLYNKFITKEEANNLIKESHLLPTEPEQKALIDFLDIELHERKQNEPRNRAKYDAMKREADKKGEILPDYIEVPQGIAIPNEWYTKTLGPKGISFSQGIEHFGLKKAKKDKWDDKIAPEIDLIENGKQQFNTDGKPIKTNKIKKMGLEYEKLFVERFDKNLPNSKWTDPIRSIEHRRVMYQLIEKYFPKSDEDIEELKKDKPLSLSSNAIFNKVFKALLFNPSYDDMIKQFDTTYNHETSVSDKDKNKISDKNKKGLIYTDTHKAFISSIDPKQLEKLEKWMSTYFFSVHAPKVYFDFTGLLFICTNLSNKNILNKQSRIEKGTITKLMNIDKIQNIIISKCHKLKNDNTPLDTSILPNAYIVKLIEDIKTIHTNLEDFTILTDFEGDDITAILAAYNFLPNEINLNIVIQRTSNLLDSRLKLNKNIIDKNPVFKEETLEKWFNDNNVESSLLTVNSILAFLTDEFTRTYNKRTTYEFIDIDYTTRIPIISTLFDNDLIELIVKINSSTDQNEKDKLLEKHKNLQKKINILKNTDSRLEFFEYPKNKEGKDQGLGLILQDVIPGISPNICKVTDAFLQMYLTNKEKIFELLQKIKQNAIANIITEQKELEETKSKLQSKLEETRKQLTL
jgi:hypothetical protein